MKRLSGAFSGMIVLMAALSIGVVGPVAAETVPTATSDAAAETVAAGWGHTCAVVRKTIRCAGENEFGQLGNGTTSNLDANPIPSTVDTSETQITALAAGLYHTCALFSPDRSVTCWGWNGYGQLGTEDTTDRLVPAAPVSLADVTSVVAGSTHTCAVVSGGSVWCWGSNTSGQLGNAQDGCDPNDLGNCYSPSPVEVAGLGEVQQVTAGDAHTCALLKSGHVACWGSNGVGQLGNDQHGCDSNNLGACVSTTPVSVSGLSDVTSISAGKNHTCAVTGGGAVKCWGWNDAGQLGDGTTHDRATPTTAIGKGAAEVAAGWDHTCAITTKDAVACWGRNQDGELGDGTKVERHRPVAVRYLGLDSGATELTAGYQDTCARLEGDHIQCWGKNDFGQLGNGTQKNRTTPAGTLLGGPTLEFALAEKGETAVKHGKAVLTRLSGAGELQIAYWPSGAEEVPVIGGTGTLHLQVWTIYVNNKKVVQDDLRLAVVPEGTFVDSSLSTRLEPLNVVVRKSDPDETQTCAVGSAGTLNLLEGHHGTADQVQVEIPGCDLRQTFIAGETGSGGHVSVAISLEPHP